MFDNLYIHVPFCQSKCGYCAFYSIPSAGDPLYTQYVTAVERRMAEYQMIESFKSIYFGGGTPSILPKKLFERLFLAVNAYFKLDDNVEISIECNPETVDAEKAGLISAFANRISLGVQSFSPEQRQVLDRKAGNADIENAIARFRQYGVDNLSIDLIYAMPGQTLEDWLEELRLAVEFGIEHISCYSLTMEEGTLLAEQHGINAVDEELSAEMWYAAGEFLKKHGFERYEISNYAIPGHECKHNQNIWHGGTYLGFGPAACSFDGKRRWTQVPDLRQWLDRTPPEVDELPIRERAREIFAFGLRTAAGWEQKTWELLQPEITAALPWEHILSRKELPVLCSQNLLEMEPEWIRPTEQGMAFWDNIATALL